MASRSVDWSPDPTRKLDAWLRKRQSPRDGGGSTTCDEPGRRQATAASAVSFSATTSVAGLSAGYTLTR
jgi:hypothetical protein